MKYENVINSIRLSDPSNDWSLLRSGGNTIAVLKDDVNIRIENDEESDLDNDDFAEPWATGHPNPVATSQVYRIYYGSSLIREVLIVWVDGGRAGVPLPKAGTTTVDPFEAVVASVVSSRFGEYLTRSGLTCDF